MRKAITIFEAFTETIEGLTGNGIFLVSGKEGNPMTIGWGTIGRIWGKPIFTVLVRPSRYTHGLLENTEEFSVNVPTEKLKDKLEYCGEHSGRDVNKVTVCGFTLKRGINISVPYIEECPLHYERRVIHKNRVIPENLGDLITKEYYSDGDYHTIYFGEILGIYREV